jgi:hypothetical protein
MSRVVLDPQREAQLRKTFNIAGAEMAAPTELSDTIQLVYDVFGGAAASSSFTIPGFTEEVDVSAAGIRIISTVAIPVGFYNWVHLIAGGHNEAVVHRLSMFFTSVANTLGAAGTTFATGTFDNTQGNNLSIPRNIIIPSGKFVSLQVDALGAGNVLTLALEFIQLPVGTPFPIV